MSNETLDFLRGWTEKQDAVLAAIGADITAIRDGQVRIEQRLTRIEDKVRALARLNLDNRQGIV